MSEINCPQCGIKISITEALSNELAEKYKKEFTANLRKVESDYQKKFQEIETEIHQRLIKEKKILEEKIFAQNRLENEELKHQIIEKNKRLQEAQKFEIDLRKRARELEDREKELEINLQRKFDRERSHLEQGVARRLLEENRLKVAEKDKQLEDMRKQIEELRRKSEQGSQQTQGEVLELEIESMLKAMFPTDLIEPVAKGLRGGDIVQRILTPSGQIAGTIIWETKRTKSWSDTWIDKLKEDQRAIAAECGVIITQILPKGLTRMGLIDGIWVVDFSTTTGIALALRMQIIQVFYAKAISAGKDQKLDSLYNYLTGTQFKQKIEAIVDAFKAMQSDLDREKRAIVKSWAAREQQIARVLNSTVGMYGDVQGIVGNSLPKIESIELGFD